MNVIWSARAVEESSRGRVSAYYLDGECDSYVTGLTSVVPIDDAT